MLQNPDRKPCSNPSSPRKEPYSNYSGPSLKPPPSLDTLKSPTPQHPSVGQLSGKGVLAGGPATGVKPAQQSMA